jgi:hypothetical protein
MSLTGLRLRQRYEHKKGQHSQQEMPATNVFSQPLKSHDHPRALYHAARLLAASFSYPTAFLTA